MVPLIAGGRNGLPSWLAINAVLHQLFGIG